MSRLTVYGSGLPSGGAVGQTLTQGAAGAVWATPYTPVVPAVGGVLSTNTGTEGLNAPGGTSVLGANGVMLIPVYLAVPMSFSDMGVNVTASVAGATVQLGFYTFTSFTAATESLITDMGAASGAATGYQSVTPAQPSAVMGPGYINVAVKASAAVTVTTFLNPYGFQSKNVPGQALYATRNQAGAAGAFPAQYTSLAYQNYATIFVSMTRAS